MHHNPNFSKSYTGENLAFGVLKNLAFYKIYSEKITKIEVKCTRFFKIFPQHITFFSYQGPVNTLKLVLVFMLILCFVAIGPNLKFDPFSPNMPAKSLIAHNHVNSDNMSI